jgi:hypothetical protein
MSVIDLRISTGYLSVADVIVAWDALAAVVTGRDENGAWLLDVALAGVGWRRTPMPDETTMRAVLEQIRAAAGSAGAPLVQINDSLTLRPSRVPVVELVQDADGITAKFHLAVGGAQYAAEAGFGRIPRREAALHILTAFESADPAPAV